MVGFGLFAFTVALIEIEQRVGRTKGSFARADCTIRATAKQIGST